MTCSKFNLENILLQNLRRQPRPQLIILRLRLLRIKVTTIQSIEIFPKHTYTQMDFILLKRFDTNEIGLPFEIAKCSNYCVDYENVLCKINIYMHLFNYELFVILID